MCRDLDESSFERGLQRGRVSQLSRAEYLITAFMMNLKGVIVRECRHRQRISGLRCTHSLIAYRKVPCASA